MIKVFEELNLFSESKIDMSKDCPYVDYAEKHGIETKSNCIGFSEKEQKWYGWSHRAIYGFKIGDKCKDGDLGVGDGYTFKDGDKLKTLDDCKQRAIDFAASVD